MSELHKNALYIRKWLLMNSQYHDTSYTTNEAYETARHYAEKLDVHDTHTSENPNNPNKPYYNFRVKIGKPKLRGRASYTLLPQSLDFTTSHNSIFIKPNYKVPSWYQGLVQSIYGSTRRRIRRGLRYGPRGNFSGHPHVGSDGNPCLGGWSSAWSATVANNNLISLVPVAQSFLNTWTSNDAYWDINRSHSVWRTLPDLFRKELSFAEWLAKVHVWYKFSNDLDNGMRIREFDFPRWCNNNSSMVQQLLMDGIPLEKIMDGFYGYYLKDRIVTDTEDGIMRKVKVVMNYFRDIHNLAMDPVLNHLNCTDSVAGALIIEAITDTAELYIKDPWDSGPSRLPITENARINDYIDSSIQDTISSSGNASAQNLELCQILDFIRHIHNPTKGAFYRTSYIDKNDVIRGMTYYTSSSNGGSGYYRYLYLVDSITKALGIKLPNLRAQYIDDDQTTRMKSKGFINHMLTVYDWIDDGHNEAYGEPMTKAYQYFAFKALDIYEKLLFKTIKRRTRYGKDSLGPNLHNINTGDNEQQSQIPIESF